MSKNQVRAAIVASLGVVATGGVVAMGSRIGDGPAGVYEPVKANKNIKRNARCHCGSGKKYKICCRNKPAAAGQQPQQQWLYRTNGQSSQAAIEKLNK